MEIKIDESAYQLQKGDFILINANKRHSCVGTQGILAARFFIDFHEKLFIVATEKKYDGFNQKS